MFGGGKKKEVEPHHPTYGRDSVATIYGTADVPNLGRGRSSSFDDLAQYAGRGGKGGYHVYDGESDVGQGSGASSHWRSQTPPPGALEGRRGRSPPHSTLDGRRGRSKKTIYVEDDQVEMTDDHGKVKLGGGMLSVEQADGARVMMDDRGVEMLSNSGQRFHVSNRGGDMRLQTDSLTLEKGGRSASRRRGNERNRGRSRSSSYDSREEQDNRRRARRRDANRSRDANRDRECRCRGTGCTTTTCCHAPLPPHHHTHTSTCCGGGGFHQSTTLQHTCQAPIVAQPPVMLPPQRTMTHSHSTTYVPVPVTPPHERFQVVRHQVPGSIGYPGQSFNSFQQQALASGQPITAGQPMGMLTAMPSQGGRNMAVMREVNGVPVVMPLTGAEKRRY